MNKVCTKCFDEKDLEDFPTKYGAKRKDGTRNEYKGSICKICENKRKYEAKRRTPEKIVEYKRRSNERRRKSYLANKEKQNQRGKEWIKDLIDRKEFKPKWLWSKYKITMEDYNELRERQNYSCAICGISEEDYGRALHVDHCHETGIVRGLLCFTCNSAIGLLKDNVKNLKAAINYLTSS